MSLVIGSRVFKQSVIRYDPGHSIKIFDGFLSALYNAFSLKSIEQLGPDPTKSFEPLNTSNAQSSRGVFCGRKPSLGVDGCLPCKIGRRF